METSLLSILKREDECVKRINALERSIGKAHMDIKRNEFILSKDANDVLAQVTINCAEIVIKHDKMLLEHAKQELVEIRKEIAKYMKGGMYKHVSAE